MAKFQNTTPRPDTVPKRGLAPNDIAFLKDLQAQLNTQDTMCQAAPRFWAISAETLMPAKPMDAEVVTVSQPSTGLSWEIQDLNGIRTFLSDSTLKNFVLLTGDRMTVRGDEDAVTVTFGTDSKPVRIRYTLRSPSDVAVMLDDVAENFESLPFRVDYWVRRQAIQPDTLFLTHAECERHLRDYGYNYPGDAHAYAMTAQRSPQVAHLLALLEQADWDSVLPATGSGV